MRKFIANILFYLGILISVNLLFNYIIWKNYYKDYGEIKLNYETYLVADSHGKPLADFMEHEGIFNFSAVSDSYVDMHRKIKFLIKHSNVKKIILTVDDHTLSKYRENTNNLDRSVIYSTAADFPQYIDFLKDRYLKRYIAFSNAKSRDILTALFLSKLKHGKGKKDWNLLTQKERIDLARSRAAVQFPDELQSATLITELQEIISLCQSHKIELVGIKFPLTAEYNSLTAGKSYKADSLFRKNNLPVLDFSHLYAGNNAFFTDQDHLNKTGSKAFCNVLLDNLKNNQTQIATGNTAVILHSL